MKKLLVLLLACVLIFSVTLTLSSCDTISALMGGSNSNGGSNNNNGGSDGGNTDDTVGGDTTDGDNNFEYSDGTTGNDGGSIGLPMFPAPDSPIEDPEAEEGSSEN